MSRELAVNPRLARVPPYIPERLRALLAGIVPKPDPAKPPVVLAAGEPRHESPAAVRAALHEASARLQDYPDARGEAALREAIAGWLGRRFAPLRLDPASEVLPTLGSREAIFDIVQCLVDPAAESVAVIPNPLYPIYEGAAILAGAVPYFAADVLAVAPDVLERAALLFVCSPSNPTGRVLGQDEWARLFEQSDRHGFVLVADECYSEIYPDESRPPVGALQAAARLGRGLRNIVSLGSLSKRSSVPGLRSGYAAGDPTVLAAFLHYRTYSGSAMGPPAQAASIAAFDDDAYVVANREAYRRKLVAFHAIVAPVAALPMPEGGFYFWMPTPGDDLTFVQRLYAEENVKVLPGSFFGRDGSGAAGGANPGSGRVRISMTAPYDECVEGAKRIAALLGRWR